MDISIEAQDRDWAHTPRGKVICPECGLSGYRGGKWVRKHVEHVQCSCGRTVTTVGLQQHRGSMARHGKPCP